MGKKIVVFGKYEPVWINGRFDLVEITKKKKSKYKELSVHLIGFPCNTGTPYNPRITNKINEVTCSKCLRKIGAE